MKIGYFIIALLTSQVLFASLGTQRAVFDQANQAYEEVNYVKAIELYENLLEEGLYGDDIHYNLANSYFKSADIAMAILHYEKALKLNPSHEDAAFNLAIANAKTVDKIESIPELFIYRWWKAIYQVFTIDQWAWLCVLAFIGCFLLFVCYLFVPQLSIRKVSFYSAAICLVLALSSWLMAAQQKGSLSSHTDAIIVQATANIISAPSEGSSQLFVLHEGSKVRIKSELNDWIEIALPNGNKGWLKKVALIKI